ncbi:GntR family transcriptional regulator [Nocardioides sp. Soil805]|uniref:GntR family transcriptional regulator n=1 Tax=Nocardioides sp. Soil805 TaxID=1736416 RepID=UPI0007034818|nr:GntR family transcriptional regulator [Nocardioides sp. Soil805]KRF35232.1 GntR family transcriptional regulator [Nocardioides sp. Soil805]
MELARIDLDPLDPQSATPPYEQVRVQVAARITDGRLPAGSRLPTVRALAEELGLAVNTVARVYKELEADGLVATEGRRGTRVTGTVATPSAVRDAAESLALEARRAGLTLAEATRLLEQGWSR